MKNIKKIVSATAAAALLCSIPGVGTLGGMVAWAAEITTVETSVYETVENEVYDIVEDSVYDLVDEYVYDVVEDVVYDTVEDVVYDVVDEVVYDVVEDVVYDTVEDSVYNTVAGHVYYEGLGADVFALVIDEPTASVFGEIKENDVAPMVVNDITMLPARFVAENLDATVAWDGETKTVTITGADVEIKVTIGSDIATVNGVEEQLGCAPFVENDRTYTPVGFIAEKLGATVEWDPFFTMVKIVKNA